MGAFVRTSRNTEIALPFIVAVPLALVWLMLMALAYVGLAILAGILLAARYVQQRRR